MFTVSECDLISNTLTSHEPAPIRGRPTLKDAERFRTGSIIHESKNTFGYVKTCYKCYTKKCQKYTKSCQKYYTKSEQKCDKSTTKMTNNTQTNLQKTNVNSQSSCCTVNEHMVNMAASWKATKNMDNAISSEQIPTKNFSTLLSKDDMENKNVSTDQCMSGTNISNNCISKLNINQNKITGSSKLKAMRTKKLPVRSRHALFYNVCTQKHVTDITTTGCHLRHRDREMVKWKVKWLTRKFGKSRLLRKRLRHKVKRSVPRSSHLHYIVENIMHCQDTRMKCIPGAGCSKAD
jgi:hypothetical protein